LENIIQFFLSYVKAEGLSQRTIRDYHYHLKAFSSLVDTEKGNYREATFSYLSAAANPNTYNLRFNYLKKFFTWCISESLINCEKHPLTGLKKRKATNRIVHVENNDIERLLDLPDKKTYTGLRNYTLILFSIDTGIRPGESLRLTQEDFNFASLLINVPAPIAKSRKSRLVPISVQTAMAVKKLLSVHHSDWSEDTPVFASQDGSFMAVNTWSHILQSYSKKLLVKITPYYLRHVFALSMLRAGCDVFTLRDMMGHSDISMTSKYLAITVDDMKLQHRQCSLVNVVLPIKKRVRKIV